MRVGSQVELHERPGTRSMAHPQGIDLATATSTTLLEGLQDPANSEVWCGYVARFERPILRYACHLGLGREDAEDVAQRTLLAFSTALRAGKYDPRKGRLRDWLFGITRLEVRQALRERLRTGRPTGHEVSISDVAEIPEDKAPDAAWDEEWRSAMLESALAAVRREVEPHTFAAFELFAVQRKRAREVAELLGMSANAVFLAKRRILRRIRAILSRLEEGT